MRLLRRIIMIINLLFYQQDHGHLMMTRPEYILAMNLLSTQNHVHLMMTHPGNGPDILTRNT